MKIPLMLLITSVILVSCSKENIYTVEKISNNPDGRVDYALTNRDGQKMILRQKKSDSLVLGSKLEFDRE
jgi:hypothetical protein